MRVPIFLGNGGREGGRASDGAGWGKKSSFVGLRDLLLASTLWTGRKNQISISQTEKNDFPNVFYCVRAFSPRRAILARVTRGAAGMGDAQPRKRGAVAAEDEDEVGRAHFGSGKQGGETRSPASFGCIAFPHQQRPHGPPRPSSKHGGDVGRCQTPPWPPPRQEFIPDYPHTDTGLSVMIILMPRPGVRERGPV